MNITIILIRLLTAAPFYGCDNRMQVSVNDRSSNRGITNQGDAEPEN